MSEDVDYLLGGKKVFDSNQVSFIREGKLIYNPSVVEGITRLGKRLANVDTYVDANGVMRERSHTMLMADVDDFFQLISLFQSQALELSLYHDLLLNRIKNHASSEIPFSEKVWFYLAPIARFFGCTSSSHREGQNAKVTVPGAVQRYQRFEKLVFLVHLVIGVLDDLSDVYFIYNLSQIEAMHSLYVLSLSIFIGMTFVRQLVLLYHTTSSKSIFARFEKMTRSPFSIRNLSFVGYSLIWLVSTAFIPELSIWLVKEEFSHKPTVKQNILGESSGSFFIDPVAFESISTYREESSILGFAVSFALKDMMQLGVQVQFLTLGYDEEGEDIGVAFWLAFVTTVFRVVEQVTVIASIYFGLPMLKNLMLARHLSFKNEVGRDGQPGNDTSSLDHITVEIRDSPVPMAIQYPVPMAIQNFLIMHNSSNLQTAFARHLEPVLLEKGESLEKGEERSRDLVPFKLLFPCKRPLRESTFFLDVRIIELNGISFGDRHEDLSKLLEKCKNLQKIDLSYTSFEVKTDKPINVLQTISKHCPRVDQIGLDGCEWVDEKSVCRMLALVGESLIRLSLKDLSQITDDTLRSIGAFCPNIQELLLDLGHFKDTKLKGGQKSSRRKSSHAKEKEKRNSRFTKIGLEALSKGQCSKTLITFHLTEQESPRYKVPLLDLLRNKNLRDVSLDGVTCVDNNFIKDFLTLPKERLDLLKKVFDVEMCPCVYKFQKNLQLPKLRELRLCHTKCDSNRSKEKQPAPRLGSEEKPSAPQLGSKEKKSPPQLESEEEKSALQLLNENSTFLEFLSLAGTKTILQDRKAFLKSPQMQHVAFDNENEWKKFYIENLKRHRKAYNDKMADSKASGRIEFQKVTEPISENDNLSELILDADRYRRLVDRDKAFFPPPLGVATTKRLNIVVDTRNKKYRNLNPTESQKVGYISSLYEVNANRSFDSRSTKQEERNERLAILSMHELAIPKRAKYFAFAYPINESAKELDLYRANAESPLDRLMKYGGFFYFDESRAFLSASLFTLGAAISFDSGREISEKSSKVLSSRWHQYTIKPMPPQEKLRFAWVFPHEFPYIKGFENNDYGGFAFWFENTKPSESWVRFYPMAALDKVFLEDPGNEDASSFKEIDRHLQTDETANEQSDQEIDPWSTYLPSGLWNLLPSSLPSGIENFWNQFRNFGSRIQ